MCHLYLTGVAYILQCAPDLIKQFENTHDWSKSIFLDLKTTPRWMTDICSYIYLEEVVSVKFTRWAKVFIAGPEILYWTACL